MSNEHIDLLIAHVLQQENGDWEKPHLLTDHVEGVARLAENFAKKFKNGDWGYAAGLLHDLGKSSKDFQKYIRSQSGYGYDANAHLETLTGKVVHSTHGAVWACQQWPGIGKILSYLVAGHHGGLPDWFHEQGVGGNLANRLDEDAVEKLPEPDFNFMNYLSEQLSIPQTTPCGGEPLSSEAIHLWMRMLFSCLVDADFLDTEQYMNKAQSAIRGKYSSLEELMVRIEKFMADFDPAGSAVNQIRDAILRQCRSQAELHPGFFTLTVPTGGGKTLASMVFALRHALRYQKDRIIMVIPYTSIIEQTSQVYKKVFGEENVIEHHSALDPDSETWASRLAAENWDAPIIVTTSVQFFESLFSAKSSSCRKLHNITNSVVIIDEVQMLPYDYLKPVLQSLGTLVNHFNVTTVLCSATQPAIAGRIGSGSAAFTGLAENICREIMQNPRPDFLTEQLKRVEVKELGKIENWQTLAEELQQHSSVLCVVNTRGDCRELFNLMPEGTIHLSANMCGEHRSRVIRDIKEKLSAKEKVQVVSTQLVEAGVDFDFPVVFRAMAGLDSIAQAAGRCNREGLLKDGQRYVNGQVFVFESPKRAPVGTLRKGEQAGMTILSVDPEGAKALTPETFRKYFHLFFNDLTTFDRKNLYDLLVKDAASIEIQFRTAAKELQMIDNLDQVPVIVKYIGEKVNSAKLINELKFAGPSRNLLRKLQRFTITLPEKVFLEVQSGFEDVNGYWCQLADTVYDDVLGFVGFEGEIPIC